MKRIFSAERYTRVVMSSRKKKFAAKRSSPLRGSVVCSSDHPKLSPPSHALPILVSCLVVLSLAHASLVERPGIGVPRPVAQ